MKYCETGYTNSAGRARCNGSRSGGNGFIMVVVQAHLEFFFWCGLILRPYIINFFILKLCYENHVKIS